MPHYHVNDNLCKIWGIDCNLDWLVIDHLCELVDNDKD